MDVHETGTGRKGNDGTTAAVLLMLGLMVTICAGMLLAVSLASAVGGPIAWGAAVLFIVALALAHLKLMNHGGH